MAAVALAVSMVWVSAPATVFAQGMPPYGAPITLERAKQAVAAAVVEMRKRKLDMTIAVVDSGSNLVYLERSDQAGIGTVDAAIGKAKAANGIKTPTKAIEDMILNQNQSNLLAVPGAFPVEGGVLIIVDNKPSAPLVPVAACLPTMVWLPMLGRRICSLETRRMP
jgi:uncharacterized protein GlcG (DUF336 family)